jgi:CHAT domain
VIDSPGNEAEVTVRVTKPGTAYRIEISAGDDHTCILPVDETTMNQARDGLADDLEEIKNEVGSALDLASWDDVRAAMQKLKQKSEDLTWRLLGKNPDRLESLDEVLAQGLALAGGLRYPLVDVRTESGFSFPFELLLARPFESCQIRNKTDLLEACRAFLGFSAVLRRTIVPAETDKPSDLDQNSFLWNENGLAVKFFFYSRLEGAQAEREFFGRQDTRNLSVDGPWPLEPTTADTAAARCAEVIFDPRTTFAGRKRKHPDHIQHFACHCDTFGTNSDDYTIRLAAGEHDHVDIRLVDLDAGLQDLTFRRRKKRGWAMPIVFLNACASSKIEFTAAASLPKLFLDQGNRAFIGTETNIPDVVAAQMSEYFYRGFLAGATVGEALNEAKKRLVMLHGNPLGLLYTLYGNPDLRVSRPVPEEAIA